ncbi:carbohydrate esterase family 3 protein [Karstenula rhodostoma CBS 690.94]|uniref:Carbohydrate esterase family 3 protein n=1 Tax=Karstenula rhodostoma CBS 690.94 TaxID=1392251 RepID=A0A9P4P7U2_9PLEO|nr:carbohydrate esterase family 3 protein [Karstenula rhodostoma CBS 690.94]
MAPSLASLLSLGLTCTLFSAISAVPIATPNAAAPSRLFRRDESLISESLQSLSKYDETILPYLTNRTSEDWGITDVERFPYWPSFDEFLETNKSMYTVSNRTFLEHLEDFDIEHGNSSTVGQLSRRQSRPLLRIMALGASITQGLDINIPEPDQGGYRQPLRQQLRSQGWEVNFIGSKKNGLFEDNENEGHPGKLIADVHQAMNPVMRTQKPNLVLINAGTNDCTQADNPALVGLPGGMEFVQGVPTRMKSMLDQIYDESKDVTVILSTLLPNFGGGNIPSYVAAANQGIRQLINNERAAGRKILLAEMDGGWFSYPADFSDTTHPNTAGYKKMASVWWGAFERANSQSYISAPIDTGLGDGGDVGGECVPQKSAFTAGPKLSNSFGANDGNYIHKSAPRGTDVQISTLFKSQMMSSWQNFHFATMSIIHPETVETPFEDLVMILDPEERTVRNLNGRPGDSYMQYKSNAGRLAEAGEQHGFQWIKVNILEDGTPECRSRGVRFGDVNGDGLSDFICINQDGEPFVSLNRGGSPPRFEFIGNIFPKPGFLQKQVRLGDIDGDGRLDYCGLKDNGDMACWRNGGRGDAPIAKFGGFWQGIVGGASGGSTFTGKGMGDIAGTRLVDINGDGRADWVWVYDNGQTRIFINQNGAKADGGGLTPHWVEAAAAHPGFGSDMSNRNEVLFGRVFGSRRADYIRVKETFHKRGSVQNVDYDTWDYDMTYFQNQGSGGTRRNGDGIRFCDMKGRGYDDMLYIYDGGMVDMYERTDSGDKPTFSTTPIRLVETAVNRKYVHVEKWFGSGRCDILTVGLTGIVNVRRNNLNGNSVSIASPVVAVATGLCAQTWSPHPYDLAVRFGDLDGDGRVDYLCMLPNGRTTGWLNKESGLETLNQVKVSVGFERQNHRWADVTGDGRVDFIWVDKHTGNVQFWRNNGFMPSIGSSMNWVGYPGNWMAGVDRGDNVRFPNLRKSSPRADYYIVNPSTGGGAIYYNDCKGGDGGVGPGPDQGAGPTNPGLPANPGDGTSPICPRTKCGEWPDMPHFIALGDSYAAGIGAGESIIDEYDSGNGCMRGSNANSRRLFYDTPSLKNKKFDFIACTGDTTQNILVDKSGPRGRPQLQILGDISSNQYSVVTLSIGGNDVGFSDVAINCLIDGHPDCEDKMQKAEGMLNSGTGPNKELKDKLKKVYASILDGMTTAEKWLIVYGYGRFFNDEDQSATPDENCDTLHFGVAAPIHVPVLNYNVPYLTLSKRRRINNAVNFLNKLIQEALSEIKSEYPGAKVRFVDMDPLYEGYRFCDKDENGRIKSFQDSGFFLAFANDMLADPNTGMPIVGPRDPNDGPKFGDLSKPSCDAEWDSLELNQKWYCMFARHTEFNCDLYPQLCQDSKRDLEGLERRQTHPGDLANQVANKAMKSGMKAFHPKSFIHMAGAALVQNQYRSWQQDNDGNCPCTE